MKRLSREWSLIASDIWFKTLIKGISYNKVSAILKYFETLWHVLRYLPMHGLVVFGNGVGLVFMSFCRIT